MIKNECEHEWEKHTNFKQNLGTSTYLCKKCNTNMTAAEVFQLEALENQAKSLENQTKLANHQLGFQKHIAVIAIIISFLALIISLFK